MKTCRVEDAPAKNTGFFGYGRLANLGAQAQGDRRCASQILELFCSFLRWHSSAQTFVHYSGAPGLQSLIGDAALLTQSQTLEVL
jgi:hypothetical protein